MPFVAGITGGVIVGLFGWMAIAAGWVASDSPPASSASALASAGPPLTQPVAEGDALTAGEVYERAGPAVAFVAAEVGGGSSELGGIPGNSGSATGSGFLIDDNGTILTNAHVVDGATSVTVKLGEDGETLDAEVLGSDISTDVAVLRVDSTKVTAVPLQLADSDEANVGDAVVAIGNPFGLERTVTTGIVSATGRGISAPDESRIVNAIQTDASINPGNSGGPLLNARGEVLGINSQIQTAGGQGSVGIGFAVPINTVSHVTDQILEDGTADHAFIGIVGTELTPELADLLNEEQTEGALIQEVTNGSPAEDAGLQGGDATMTVEGQEIRVGGDVIVGVDGESIENFDDVITAVGEKDPGDTIALDIIRDGQPRTVSVVLGDRPQETTG